MDIGRKEALVAIRAFRGLRRRLDALGDSPSLESLQHIDELAHAYGGQMLSKNISTESATDYASALGDRLDAVVSSLEGLFSWFKSGGEKAKKQEAKAAAEPRDTIEDQLRHIKEAKTGTPSGNPVNIDGTAGGALSPVNGVEKDPAKLYELLKKDYTALSSAFSDFKSKESAWISWAQKADKDIAAVVSEPNGDTKEEFDEAALIKVVKQIHSSRKKRPAELIDVKHKLVLKSITNLGDEGSPNYTGTPKYEQGSVQIDPITDKALLGKLADLANNYSKLGIEIEEYLLNLGDDVSLPGGDDQPYRYPPVMDAIDEAIGAQHLDWEAHSFYATLDLAEDIQAAVDKKFDAIAKWLSRAVTKA